MHPVLGSVWEGMGLALQAAAQFPRIPSAKNYHRPRVLRTPPPRKLVDPAGHWPAPLPERAERAVGTSLGPGAAGAQWVGPSGRGRSGVTGR